MSLYDGIEVETAPISSIHIDQNYGENGQGERMDSSTASMANTSSTHASGFAGGLSSSLKFLAPQIQRKKAAAKTAPQRIRAAQTPKTILGTTIHQGSNILCNQPSELVDDHFAMGVADEYDPFNPNDYDVIMKERRPKEGEEDKRGNREEHKRHDGGERKRRHSSDSEGEEEKEKRKESRRKERAAIPPPVALSSETPSNKVEDNKEDAMPTISSALLKKAPKKKTLFSSKFGSKVASNIMNKYGWKEGHGLGKSEQGINTALSVEKTSKRGGKIIDLAAAEKAQVMQQEQVVEEKKPLSITEIMRNPTKVILLMNMVGPGEVDDDLQPEVTEECSKYGEVVKCIAYEIPGLPDDEAVRIFVEFTRVESAIKAIVDLNGRFFGGRTVTGSFFDHKKFANYDLAP